jgi:hypothetical protein
MVLSFYRGPVAAQLGGVDISFLVGLATSGTIYALLCRSLDRGREQRAIAASEAALAGQDPSDSPVRVPVAAGS